MELVTSVADAWMVAVLAVLNGTTLIAVLSVCWVPPRAAAVRRAGPLVTIVRPFRGREQGGLDKNLSLLRQRYRPLEVFFVAESPSDPGARDAHVASASGPGLASVRFSGPCGLEGVPSGKARNMIAGWRASAAPFVAFADSDLALHPDDLARCMGQFDHPRVGAVFVPCLFTADGIAGQLATFMGADAYLFAMAASRLRKVSFLQGGFMVLRRAAVDAAGGIECVGDAVADDLRLANVLRRAGYEIRVTEAPRVHHSPVESVRSWAARYHRWMVAQHAGVPVAFWLQLLFHPTIVPLLALTAPRPSWWVPICVVTSRVVSAAWVDRAMLRAHRVRLGVLVLARPLLDVLHLVFCCAALVVPVVEWRGRRYRVDGRGRILASGCARTRQPRRASAESGLPVSE